MSPTKFFNFVGPDLGDFFCIFLIKNTCPTLPIFSMINVSGIAPQLLQCRKKDRNERVSTGHFINCFGDIRMCGAWVCIAHWKCDHHATNYM